MRAAVGRPTAEKFTRVAPLVVQLPGRSLAGHLPLAQPLGSEVEAETEEPGGHVDHRAPVMYSGPHDGGRLHADSQMTKHPGRSFSEPPRR
jgi:hypothetical protein